MACLPGGVSAPGGGIPACTEADTPPVNRMTDRCKNITLATTLLRPVIKCALNLEHPNNDESSQTHDSIDALDKFNHFNSSQSNLHEL